MKIVNEVPKEGQFVAVWDCNGRLFSETYMVKDDKIYQYVSVWGTFTIIGEFDDRDALFADGARFIV